MKILKAKVDWNPEFDNPPDLEVWVDEIPHQHVGYEQRGSCYYGEHDGYVSFYHYVSPGNGFGGREFTLTMRDGSTKTLKGPWSGNELSMAAAGFPMSYSVVLIVQHPQWGEQRFGGHITEARYLEAFKFCEHEAHLIPVRKSAPYSAECSAEQNLVIGCAVGENQNTICTYEIARIGMTFAQSQAFKRVERYTRYYHDEATWIPWIMWGAEKDRAEKQESRDKMAAHINELISTNGLEAHGCELITALLPVPEPRKRPPQDWSYPTDEDGMIDEDDSQND